MSEIISVIATVASAIATTLACGAAFFSWRSSKAANAIATDVYTFQRNSITKAEELKIVNRILELFVTYLLWEEDENIKNLNYHDHNSGGYENRGDMWSKVPQDMYFLIHTLLHQVPSNESKIKEWKDELFVTFTDKDKIQITFNDRADLPEKVEELKKIRDSIF